MSSFDKSSKLDKLGELVETHLGDGVSDLQQVEARRRFTEEVAQRQHAGRRFPLLRLAPIVGVTAGVALTLGLVLGNLGGRQDRRSNIAASPSVPFEPGPETVRLIGPSGAPDATVQLVSGATVALTPQTHGESRRVGPKAYRVNLDHGQMTFTIDPNIGTTWAVQAGAYQVRVVGTVFSVSRDQGRDAVEVHVDRGRVEISGGGLEGRTITLDAGGALRARGQMVDVQSSPAAPSEETPAPPAAAAPAPSSPRPRSVRSAAPIETKLDWQALYDAGDYAGAWRVARVAGYGPLVSDLDVKRLSHIAAAARLSGDGKGARSLLGALRRRFPGTGEAAEAAFLLGRLEADAPAATDEAAKWFETYLAERPRGVYAEEARGRLIVVFQRGGRLADARRVAREYLARHGSGPYSEVAHSVLD
jgi:transmembrane sensor